ncbi:putative F-box-like domain superfamily protein [Helianthus anomalus]
MADFPVDTIVFEILTMVTAKDVGRSKSVCKEWYALLSRQDFVRVHCSRSLISSNQRVLLIDDLARFVHPIIF